MTRWPEMIKYWELLEYDMRKVGGFSLARLKHTKLRQAWYAKRAVVVAEMDGYVPRSRICAYAARLKTKNPEWQELAWFYVVVFLTGLGILRLMVENLVATAPACIKFCGFTDKAAVRCIFERHGLVAVNKYNMPDIEEWAKQLGMYDRLSETAFRMNPPDP